MNSLIPFLPVALLLLACPLIMAGMGVVVWIVARAKGEKKPLSMSCMSGHGSDATQSTSGVPDGGLQNRVIELEAEVSALSAQLQDPLSADTPHK